MKSVILVNLITTIRLIGVIGIYPVYVRFGSLEAGILALVIYSTDFIDGFLARKLKATTFFGSLYDTVADKVLNIVCFIVLFQITTLAIIPVIIELLIAAVNYMRYKANQNVKTNIYGKIKMNILAVLIIFIFLFDQNYEIKYAAIFAPVIITELIVLFSYYMDYLENPKDFSKQKKTKTNLKNMFDHNFYEKNKDKDKIRSLQKKK